MRTSALSTLIVALTFAVLFGGCGYPRANPTFFKSGKWAGIDGPAEVQEVVICESRTAAGASTVAEAVETYLAPALFSQLDRDPRTATAKRYSKNNVLCDQLADFNDDHFDVSPKLRRAITDSFAQNPTAKTLVVPTVFIQEDASTVAVRNSTGQRVGDIETGKFEASGELVIRVYVFTVAGDLAFNGYAEMREPRYEGVRGIRDYAGEYATKATRGFPRHILRAAPPSGE